MSYPEWLRQKSTWWTRLVCRWRGHLRDEDLFSGIIERVGRYPPFCYRCGADLRSTVALFRAVSAGEMTPEEATRIFFEAQR